MIKIVTIKIENSFFSLIFYDFWMNHLKKLSQGLALFKLKNLLTLQFSPRTVFQYRQKANLRFFHIGGIMVFYWRIYYFEEIQLLLTYSCKVIVACFIDSFYYHLWFDQKSLISKIQFLFDLPHQFPFIRHPMQDSWNIICSWKHLLELETPLACHNFKDFEMFAYWWYRTMWHW